MCDGETWRAWDGVVVGQKREYKSSCTIWRPLIQLSLSFVRHCTIITSLSLLTSVFYRSCRNPLCPFPLCWGHGRPAAARFGAEHTQVKLHIPFISPKRLAKSAIHEKNKCALFIANVIDLCCPLAPAEVVEARPERRH